MKDQRYRLSDVDAKLVSKQFQTPTYVVDELSFRTRLREYQAAFKSQWPRVEASYASKANSALALLKIAYDEGYGIDVASEGELRAVLLAGVPASSCTLHGNAKLTGSIEFAVSQGIHQIVVDSFDEVELLARLDVQTPLLLRLNPGVAPETHAKIATSTKESKFGLSIANGDAERCVRQFLSKKLNLIGFHLHTGSQLLEPSSATQGALLMIDFAVRMQNDHGLKVQTINLGGGRGALYTDEEIMPVEEYQRDWLAPVTRRLHELNLDVLLSQEPGRCLIAEAGVTLLTVKVVKQVGSKTFVAVDGGLFENPRPALYEAKYTVNLLGKNESERSRITVVGSHCENDVLYPDVEVNGCPQEGDLIQVLTTGAYSSTMANNYNRFLRPPTLLRRMNGSFDVIQHRETYEQLFSREQIPGDL